MTFKNCLLIIVIIAMMLIIVFGQSSALSLEGKAYIETNNSINQQLNYYYYLPQKVIDNKAKKHPVLICIPHLSGIGWKFVSQPIKDFADEHGFIIIAPTFIFDEQNHYSFESYLYPSVWSGQALDSIVNRVMNEKEIKAGKYYLFGFSAGARFALRYALWHPDKVAAVSAHASGGVVTPKRYIPVKFYLSSGKEDKSALTAAENFHKLAKKLKIDLIYQEYPGGHVLPVEQISETLLFFEDVREKNDNSLNNELLIRVFILILLLAAFIYGIKKIREAAR